MTKDRKNKKRLLRRRLRGGEPEIDMSTVVVTPDGAYPQVGDYGNNEDMIPDGAELTDAQRHEIEGQRGARYFNNAMERGSAPFRAAAQGALFALAPTVAAPVAGTIGLYNTFSGDNGVIENTDRVFNNPKSTNWDLTKAIMPALFGTLLDASMVAPTVASAPRVAAEIAAEHGSKTAAAALVSNAIRVNADKAVDAALRSENVLGIYKPLYEKATSVTKSEPYAKVWRNGQGWNSATEYKLNTKPSYFEVVKDNEPGNYSIHFKTGDPAYGIDGRKMIDPEEKQMLFDAVRYDFPRGGRLSTWGNVSPGGVHGIERFKDDYGWVKVGDRQVQNATIPVLQKPVKPNVPFIRESDTYVKHPNWYRETHKYTPSVSDDVAIPDKKYFYYGDDAPRLIESNGVQIGYLSPDDFSQDPYVPKEYFMDIVKRDYNPRGNLEKQHAKLSRYVDDYVEYVDPAAARLYDQYSRAMGRRRDYKYTGLLYDINRGKYGVKYGNSAIFGHNRSVVDPNTGSAATMFVASHFAPENLRQGLEMTTKLGGSEIPTVFAVTPDLSPMLYKTGQFARLTQTYQPFNGEYVLKDVMINRAVEPWMATSLVSRGARIGEAEQAKVADMFKQLEFKHTYPYKPFTLKDMLSDKDIQKLNGVK